MYKKLVVILILMASVNCFSQSKKAPEAVQVTEWKKTAFMISDHFWNTAKDDLIKQLGAEGYEKAIKYSKPEYMPKEMHLMLDGTHMRSREEYWAKMSTLKTFVAARVKREQENGSANTKVLMMAPYSDNKNWDTNVKWDTVYFLVREEYVNYLNLGAKK